MKKSIHAVLSAVLTATVSFTFVASIQAGSNHGRSLSHKHIIKHNVSENATIEKVRTTLSSQTPNTIDLEPAVIPGLDILPLARSKKAAQEVDAGTQCLANRDLPGAEVAFGVAANLNPYNPDALVGLAQTLEQQGKRQQAIKVYRYLLYPKQGWQTSLEDDPILRMHFALLLANDKQWPEAVFVYEKTINEVSLGTAYPSLSVHFSPNTPEPALFQAMAHLVMGVTYNNRLEHPKALTEYQAAINAQPDFALAHYYHGQGLQRLGRGSESRAEFVKAAALGDGDVKKAAQSPNGLLLK